MEIKLLEMNLQNFKGIQKYIFKPNGKNATIRGANRKGKTTVADGFRWLLFGKDTGGKTDFDIKTRTPDGEVIPKIDHSVQGKIEIDGTEIELMKLFREKWTKKRGDANKSITGHTTEHFWDGVPVSEKKWNGRLGDLIDEEVFKMITLPGYFNSIHWSKRREILLQVCGDVSDSDVIHNHPDLNALPEILGARSIDDLRAVAKASKKKINDRLKEIPARIDELIKTLPEAITANARNAIEAYIKHVDTKIERAKDDTELAALRKQLAETQAKLSEAQAEQQKKEMEDNQEIDLKIFDMKSRIRETKSRIADAQVTIKSSQSTITGNEAIMVGLRSKYAEIAAQEQAYDEICPTCNQPLPPAQIEGAKAKFNENQAKDLTRINDQGKAFKAEVAALKDIIKEGEKTIEGLETEVAAYQKAVEAGEKEKAEVKPEIPENISNLYRELAAINDQIKTRPTTDTSELEKERREEQAKLATLDAAEKTKERIEELGQEEKDLSAEFEELERQIALMEKFVVTKVGLLEDKINSKFSLVKWKLFDIQINEGVKECCVAMLDGSTELSGSEHLNVGTDSINTLSEHWGIWAPIWYDNAESVTDLLPTKSQTIKLVVADLYKCEHCGYVFPKQKECPACKSKHIKEHPELEVSHE